MTIVINLFAGPSAKKTTTASTIFSYLKTKRYNAEFSAEFAKELVWDTDLSTLDNQIYLFGEQHRRQYRLLKKVDFIVTDSPLLMQLVYAKDACIKFKDKNWLDPFEDMVDAVFNQYENKNYFLLRGNDAYQNQGRIQTEDEAKIKDAEIRYLLDTKRVDYKEIKLAEDVIKDLGL